MRTQKVPPTFFFRGDCVEREWGILAGGYGEGGITRMLVIPASLGCYSVATCSIAIAAHSQFYRLYDPTAAAVELLNRWRAAIFSIAARFSSRGGDGLKLAQ